MSSFMSSLLLIKFMRLPGERKNSLLAALAALWAMRICLWLLPYPSLQRMVSKMKARKKKGTLSVDDIIQSVEMASKYVISASCLTRALAAKILLAMNGYDSSLLIGVSSCNGFAAHAWIERNGKIILGSSDCHFKPIYILE
jgi:hypothetical protein